MVARRAHERRLHLAQDLQAQARRVLADAVDGAPPAAPGRAPRPRARRAGVSSNWGLTMGSRSPPGAVAAAMPRSSRVSEMNDTSATVERHRLGQGQAVRRVGVEARRVGALHGHDARDPSRNDSASCPRPTSRA